MLLPIVSLIAAFVFFIFCLYLLISVLNQFRNEIKADNKNGSYASKNKESKKITSDLSNVRIGPDGFEQTEYSHGER